MPQASRLGTSWRPGPSCLPGSRAMATKTRVPAPVKELKKLGQSLWLDNIRRQLITSGELARLRDEGLTGVTSNPTIFEKAVSGSAHYDQAIVGLVPAGRQADAILWGRIVEELSAPACA